MKYFNRITLQTPESVQLEFTLAGIGSRAFALVIDYTLLALIFTGLILLGLLVGYQLTTYLSSLSIDATRLGQWLLAGFLLLSFTIFVGYFVYFETLWQGQTPGKRFAKIRVIQDNGRPVGLAQATLRALMRPLDDTCWLGTFFILLGKREKRLGDWIASTIVVQEERPIAAAAFTLSPDAQQIANQLMEKIDFTPLLPDDFAVVREYLQRRSLMHPEPRLQTAQQLAAQVKSLLTQDDLNLNMSADVFLEAVYLAYQQQLER